MNLQRALELCRQPIDASRAQMVKVNRFALIHLQDEFSKAAPLAAAVPGLESRITNLEERLVDKDVEINRLLKQIEGA